VGLVISLLPVILILVWALDFLLNRRRHLCSLPGPFPLPFLGNVLELNVPPEKMVQTMTALSKKFGPVIRIHLGSRPNVVTCSAEAFEKVLSSNKHITKGKDYRPLMPWLGTGLLTSTSTKWHSRRKLLTPAFHFKILESFLEVINHQSSILCDRVLAPLEGDTEFDIFPIVTHCALDIICETAMGQSLGSMLHSDTDYVRAVHAASSLVFHRQISPWLWQDWMFALSPTGYRMRKVLQTLHGFTEKVMAERKQEIAARQQCLEGEGQEETGGKRRLAFLDLLLEVSKGGTVLSDMDIREEVDTFMFEGHDTMATSLAFTLWLLATHPHIQDKCQEELDQIFDEDQDRSITSQDLASMKYLDSCIKESLRLYQSVPIISRQLGEDIEIGGHIIPAYTNIILVKFLLHRDPEIFPNPDKFDPERFNIKNVQARSAYSYVPFSAGPRNCIGQKFAMMEEKVVLSSILRKYRLRSSMIQPEVSIKVILRPKNGLRISLTKRTPGGSTEDIQGRQGA